MKTTHLFKMNIYHSLFYSIRLDGAKIKCLDVYFGGMLLDRTLLLKGGSYEITN